MRTLLIPGLLLCLLGAASPGSGQGPDADPGIPAFLEGTWMSTDVSTGPGQPVEQRSYVERMVATDDSTVTITAFGVGPDGGDITRDIVFRVRGDSVVMAQGDFAARGVRRGNFLTLEGRADGATYAFRLYLLDDRYIYQMDVWRGGRVVRSQSSYLVRIPAPS